MSKVSPYDQLSALLNRVTAERDQLVKENRELRAEVERLSRLLDIEAGVAYLSPEGEDQDSEHLRGEGWEQH